MGDYISELTKFYQNEKKAKNAYYEQLKEMNYKERYDNKVAISNAQEQALKYANNSMIAKGYGSQGLQESNMVSMNNNYLNALASANDRYLRRETEIDNARAQDLNRLETQKFSQEQNYLQQERNFNRQQDLNNKSSYINYFLKSFQQFGKEEDLNKYLNNNGYLKDGKINGDILKSKYNFNDSELELIKNAYESAKINLKTDKNNNDMPTVLWKNRVSFFDKNGVVRSDNLEKKFQQETQRLEDLVKVKQVKTDSYFKLINMWGDYAFVKFNKKGELEVATEEEFVNNNGKVIQYGR